MTAVVFDLDGTLVDTVFQNVVIWDQALRAHGIAVPLWNLHRRIGQSGGALLTALERQLDAPIEPERRHAIEAMHERLFLERIDAIAPLPGARDLLDALDARGTRWAIATSAGTTMARALLERLGLPLDERVVTHDDAGTSKPHPASFVVAAERLGARGSEVIVVGDATWDHVSARRMGATGIAVLSGGYGERELRDAGATLVYEDAAGILAALDDLQLGG